jgi:hypothetical protein
MDIKLENAKIQDELMKDKFETAMKFDIKDLP